MNNILPTSPLNTIVLVDEYLSYLTSLYLWMNLPTSPLNTIVLVDEYLPTSPLTCG